MELTLERIKALKHLYDCKLVSDCQTCRSNQTCFETQAWLNEQEERLKPKPEPTPDPLNNHKACLVPTRFAKRDCPGCHQYQACVFVGKGDYARYRL